MEMRFLQRKVRFRPHACSVSRERSEAKSCTMYSVLQIHVTATVDLAGLWNCDGEMLEALAEPIACPQGVVTAASLQGLPTVLAVNKQLQEETLDVIYEVTVEITMCDDYLVPHHWKSHKRMIDISRLKKILYPIHLQPVAQPDQTFLQC
jgi:hypothetical protein